MFTASRSMRVAREILRLAGPSGVNQMGAELARDHNLVRGERAFNQVDPNCHQVASAVAERHGYVVPPLPVVRERIEDHLANRQWGGRTPESRSPGVLVVREAPGMGQFHVAFEHRGKEFNYGPAGAEAPVLFRLPLSRSGRDHTESRIPKKSGNDIAVNKGGP